MLVHTEEKDGFEIRLYVFPDDDDPTGHFATGDEAADAELVRQIRDGELEWFVAKVTASKEGIELGADHLGGCCYESYEAFWKAGDYYLDMVSEAIEQAKAAIARLCAA